MKKLILLGLVLILFTSCKQEQRYFSESPEITDFKSSIDKYANGDWEGWRSHFADTAKLYINSTKSSTVADLENSQKQLLSNFSSYGFLEENSFIEMVLDSKNETWVYYWATWQGTMNYLDASVRGIRTTSTVKYVSSRNC